MNPVGQVDHDLRRRAGHYGGWRRAWEVDAMEGVLNRHGTHQNHSRQNGLPAGDVMEWAEVNRERSAGGQEEKMESDEYLKCWPTAVREAHGEQAGRHYPRTQRLEGP